MSSEVDIPDATAVFSDPAWLFVGAQESVSRDRRDALVSAGVSHVVSVMRDPPPWLVGKAGASDGPLPFEHLHVKVEDTRAADMTPHFPVVSAFLSRAESAGGRALVHCAFGQSRSVTVVVAHLVMSNRGLSLGEALERMRSRRPTACPNPSFLEQLVRLELELRDGVPSDLRPSRFPSLPPAWAFVSWRDPLRQANRFVSCHGRVLKVRQISRHPRVAVISNFLTREEAADIVAAAAPELHPSLVVRRRPERDVRRDDSRQPPIDAAPAAVPGERSEGRTSWNCRVSSTHAAVRGAIQRASYLCGLLPSHVEPAQVVRYLPGQLYRPHHDYFDPAGANFAAKTASGGQRAVTVLAYLVQPESGGKTSFPKLSLGFDPKVGDALCWWNVNDAGKEDPATLHARGARASGRKWALNLWFREKPRVGTGEGEGGEGGKGDDEGDGG